MPEVAAPRFEGFAAPRTRRGSSSAYGPVPWRMRGRTIALWYRLEDPDEARLHVPSECELPEDPVVRARFWDMYHDAGLPGENAEPTVRFREAVVAFPVTCEAVRGDFTTHMYADEASYIAFGRETMGWPLRAAAIEVTQPTQGATGGSVVEGRLVVAGQLAMEAAITLGVMRPASPAREVLPRWIGWKLIPHVDGRTMAIDELVETGPEEMQRTHVWEAKGELSFPGNSGELRYLRPREIVGAEYWDGVIARIGPGRVLGGGASA